MNDRLTRRAVTKIILAAPAALTMGTMGCQSTSGSSRASSRGGSASQQQHRDDLARWVSRLRRSTERLDQMEIAIGSEPAIQFAPLIAAK
ncbi:MAG TPA: hypothetical protein VMR54_14345 [Thermoanaerobaculia bacterium]|nr:hypothetical protein [Thermoanaerobaculia bacterium]